MTNKERPPAFLGIGPPKTATSWLYKVLSVHPEVRLPPMKEVGYLWEKQFLPDRKFTSRFIDNHWYYLARKKYLVDSSYSHLKELKRGRFDLRKLRWDFKYAFFPHTDSWYSSLFDKQFVSGDITPKYSELSETNLVDFRAFFGKTKIIITMRDPVAREWSRAKMNLCKRTNRPPREVRKNEWITHFDDPDQSKTNDYAALYLLWSKIFGSENVCAIFFDEVIADGWLVYNKVCAFLEIDPPPESLRDYIITPANVGVTGSMPKELRKYLFVKHREKMEKLSEVFLESPFPKKWITDNKKEIA